MKRIIFLLCLLTSLVCSAQNSVIKEGSSSLTKDEMWSNISKLVLSTTDHKYSEYKIISSDKTLGQIILELKQETLAGSHWEAIIKMRICIEMKDQKYRISDMGTTIGFKRGNEFNSLSGHSSSYLMDMKLDLEVIQAMFTKDEADYSSFMYNKEYYGKLLSSTPKFLKPKDEKKNNVNPTYDKYSRIVNACDAVEKEVENMKKFDIFWLEQACTQKSTF